MKKFLQFFCLVGLFNFSYAQNIMQGETVSVNADVELKVNKKLQSYTLFDLNLIELHRAVDSQGIIQLQIPNFETLEMKLRENDIRAHNYSEARNNVKQGAVRSESITYKGSSSKGKSIRLSITGDFIYGTIEADSGFFVIDQLKYFIRDSSINENRLIIYHTKDILEPNGVCAVEDENQLKNDISGQIVKTSVSSGCPILELATDADYEYYQHYGTNTSNRILGEINNIQGVYEDTFDLSIVIVFQNVWTTANDPYISSNYNNINNEISTIWNNTFSDVNKDLIHLFTGKDFGGVAGAAYGGICSSSTPTSFTADDDANSFATTAHEIGHNLGGSHSSGELCGTYQASVMCSDWKKIPLYFSSTSIGLISNTINNTSCLFDLNYIEITGKEVLCNNSTATYTLNSPFTGEINWSLSNSRATIISGQNTETVTILANSGNGNTILTAEILKDGSACTSITKKILVGTPIIFPEYYSYGDSPKYPILPYISVENNQVTEVPAYVTAEFSFEGATSSNAQMIDQSDNTITWSVIPGANGLTLNFDFYGVVDPNQYPPSQWVIWRIAAQNPCGSETFDAAFYYWEDSGGYLVYPNPADTEVTVKYISSEREKTKTQVIDIDSAFEVKITDLKGNVLTESQSAKGRNQLELKTQNIPSGTYLLQITDGSTTLAKKIIINH